MASMINKVMEMTWDEANEDAELDEIISEACLTYEGMGQLFAELLGYYGGKFDCEAMELIEKMMGEYILDTM